MDGGHTENVSLMIHMPSAFLEINFDPFGLSMVATNPALACCGLEHFGNLKINFVLCIHLAFDL